MTTYDFHGYSLADAIHKVELIIGDIRNRGAREDVTFITGFGSIQINITGLLDSYSLTYNFQPGNQGVILAIIE